MTDQLIASQFNISLRFCNDFTLSGTKGPPPPVNVSTRSRVKDR
ncbi:hypothetical protein [Candidatus Thiosymbion oneisti]|nr:hypothetical protein [Candidatus Thiosymbion oneisti]